MSEKVCYFDETDGETKTRDMTSEEKAQRDLDISALAAFVPTVVSRKAARKALAQAGKFHMVQPAIDALSEPARTLAQIDWDDSQNFERTNPTLLALGSAIGLNSSDLDQLFRAAAALE